MKLTVLGSGTYLPDPERGAPGFLLQHGTTNVLVDCGSGTLQRLARAGFDPVGLDAIVITHRHIDHCADLPAILFHIKHLPSPARLRDLPIFAGTGFQAHLDALIEAYGSSLEPTAFDLVVHELPTDGPGHTTIEEGLELDTQPAVHAAGALHLRFRNEEGLTVAFSGDSSSSPPGRICSSVSAPSRTGRSTPSTSRPRTWRSWWRRLAPAARCSPTSTRVTIPARTSPWWRARASPPSWRGMAWRSS